jgi:hypothetical protein
VQNDPSVQGRVVVLALVSVLAVMALATIPVGCTTLPATTATASASSVPAAQPDPTTTSAAVAPYTIQEPTRYDGTVEYECDQDGCWRVGGEPTYPPEYFYPDIEADNPDIQALLADVGVPATPAVDDNEAWQRIAVVWTWLSRNTRYTSTGPEAQEAHEYQQSLYVGSEPEQWMSIDDIAKVYARYHFLPWNSDGGCNEKAIIFATLLYRCGIDPDRMAVGMSHWSSKGNQHLFLVFRSGDQWYYIDPTCIDPPATTALNYKPKNIGYVSDVDYEHPYTLWTLPGSVLTRAMLVK